MLCSTHVYTEADLVPDEKGEVAYKGVGSGTSNYAPSNPELEKRIAADIDKFLEANPTVKREEIPADLLTASGSGKDLHISAGAALIQIDRISLTSKIPRKELLGIVDAHIEGWLGGLFGEEAVNVISANLEILDKLNK